MNRKLQPATRIITIASTLALVAALFLPLWRIELSAPQYPEGIALVITPNGLKGDVEIINGLNHYIGMRTLHNEDFVEFTVLPYLIGLLALFGLLTFIINRKWFFVLWAFFFILFGIVAMVDFYRWEHNYGHNLDPTAPIKVPGMAYQPPLIGYKQLLNFGAYSIPDAGGWIFIAVGLALATGLFLELRRTVKVTRKLEIRTAGTAVLAAVIFSSCSVGPEPLRPGLDACDYCKMTVTDTKFGGEYISQKGRIFRFDDIHCMKKFVSAGSISNEDIRSTWLADFSRPGELLEQQEAVLFRSENLRSPMGSNTAAFPSKEAINDLMQGSKGQIISWNDALP